MLAHDIVGSKFAMLPYLADLKYQARYLKLQHSFRQQKQGQNVQKGAEVFITSSTVKLMYRLTNYN